MPSQVSSNESTFHHLQDIFTKFTRIPLKGFELTNKNLLDRNISFSNIRFVLSSYHYGASGCPIGIESPSYIFQSVSNESFYSWCDCI